MRRVVEHVGGRGVDRDRAGLRRGVDDLAGVEGLRLGAQVAEAVGIEAHLVWFLRRGWALARCRCGRCVVGSLAGRSSPAVGGFAVAVCPEKQKDREPCWFAAPGPRLRDPRCHSLTISAGSLGARPPNDGAAHAYTCPRRGWCGSSGCGWCGQARDPSTPAARPQPKRNVAAFRWARVRDLPAPCACHARSWPWRRERAYHARWVTDAHRIDASSASSVRAHARYDGPGTDRACRRTQRPGRSGDRGRESKRPAGIRRAVLGASGA